MPSRSSLQSTLPRRALLIALLLTAAGCKKCNPPPDEPVIEIPDEVPTVEVKLQVVSIHPSVAEANKVFQSKIYGSGFEPGLTVYVGSLEAGRATVEDDNTVSVAIPALPQGTYDVKVVNPNGAKSVLRQGLTLRSSMGECRHVVVHFEFDKSGLTPEAQRTLSGAVPCYQSGNGALKVEGHADERGTIDYNLALGQRRAETVKRHLTGQGISGRRISTVSYGKERPANPAHNEAAWAENRRAEVHAYE